MRLINSFENPDKGLRFANFLKSQHINTEIDVSTNKDWGSDRYGTIESHVWVINEEDLPKAMKWLEEFNEDPENSKFDSPATTSVLGEAFLQREPSATRIESAQKVKGPQNMQQQVPSRAKEPMGKITFYTLILCTLIFIATQLTKPDVKEIPKNIPSTPLVSSTIEKRLEYDYPTAYEIIDQIVALYGEESLIDPSGLPKEGLYLLKKFYLTPYWLGIYDPLVNRLLDKEHSWKGLDAPLFEKIKQGEIWRLVTPCLLHGNILHILFNMLWLMVLGPQIELKIGAWRYIVFMVIAAIISNTAQYLMSGSNFIGFSGVICAMIVFIWARQRVAPWEGYQLERSTILFVAVFVLGMFAIQATSFIMQISGLPPLFAGIANTAHLTGALVGYVMSKIKFFAWR